MLAKNKNEFEIRIKNLEPQFVELIRDRLGIIMHSHQNYELFKTIQEACFNFNCSPEEYLQELINTPNKSPLLDHLVAGITVGETYFFRDSQQMELLQYYLLPELIKLKRDKKDLSLRIWSAGCATGEEIYSIAMLLYELLPDIEQWTIKLLATDINTKSLNKAVKGCYTQWSMRSISEYFKRKYFCKDNKNYYLIKKIKDLVNFDYLNLNEDSYPSIFNGTNAQDLVICRNVLIYIGNKSCNQLMLRMNKSVINGGYLMLGASDPIDLTGTNFIFHYRKGMIFSRPNDDQQPILISNKIPEVSKPTLKLAKKITKKQVKVTTIISDKKPAPVVTQDLIKQAMELANIGKLKEAANLCEENFKSDPMNKYSYFIYGLTLMELNRIPEAESALRKAIFLDKDFVPGHFQLGLLLLRKNQYKAGLKNLKNALTIAETKQPSAVVDGSPDLNYQRLAEILRNEIKLYTAQGVEYGN